MDPNAVSQPSNTPQQPQESDSWAPGWRSEPVPSQGTGGQPKSFDDAFRQQSDSIAKELGLDTQKQEQEQPKQAKQKQEAEAVDPQGDDELEFAPGKKLTRKELAKKLSEFEALQKKHVELEKGSGQKFRQAAEQQKQAQAQIQAAQEALKIQQRLQQVYAQAQQSNDPDLILKEFGIDPEQYRQRAVQKAYEDAQKTPEQREIDRLKAYEQELQRVRQEQQQAQLEFQKREQERQQSEQTNKLAGNLSQSMIATADKMGLPKTSLTIQRMANLLAGAKERGIDPTWEQIGEATRKQYHDDAIAVFDSMTAEQFHAIPQKTREKIRQFFLQQVKGPSPTPATVSSAPQPRQKQQKPLTAAEYNAWINNFRQPNRSA